MTVAPAAVTRLHSPFLCSPLKLSSHCASSFSFQSARNQRSPPSYPRIRAIELDQNTVVAISVGLVSVAIGIGIPVFYETQIDNAAQRDNTQPCFPCSGSGAQTCRFCTGSGNVTVDLGGGEKEVSKCINCDGAGALTCTTCQGSGIQPRYLDRSDPLLQFTLMYLRMSKFYVAFDHLKDLRDEGEKTLKKSEQHVVC